MRLPSTHHALFASLAATFFVACGSEPAGSGATTSSASLSASVTAPDKPREPVAAPERGGGALMRSADGARLYLADEDHKVLRILPLPFGAEPPVPPPPAPSASAAGSASAPSTASAAPSATGSASAPGASASASSPPPPPAAPPSGKAPPRPPPPSAIQEEIALPGAPAQVLPVDGFVLVTIRDPGLLLVFREKPGNKLEEHGRIPVAADAWGIAITKDEKVAVVTSAWTHQVTGVDWRGGKVLWQSNVDREPRGVVVHPDGKTAYVSHLTSGDLTRIDGVATPSVKVSKVAFPAAPSRTPQGTTLRGSLGYALVIDDAGHRLLAARHALGALADRAWFGISTIDVLQTANDQPLLARRELDKRIETAPVFQEMRQAGRAAGGSGLYLNGFESPRLDQTGPVQPRAMIIAHRSQTVWVASEGNDTVHEFPLFAAAPVERSLHYKRVGDHYKDEKLGSLLGNWDDTDGVPGECGAPTGLALSADEALLYVFCRSTYDVATVRIGAPAPGAGVQGLDDLPPVVVARVAPDSTNDAMSRGRRLFYGANDVASSGGMGCAGCHPEGRDDGHVWHDAEGNFLATQYLAPKTKGGKLGYPRQTPMLAGRVASNGPFGWHAQAETLAARLAEGFSLHRWGSSRTVPPWMLAPRADSLGTFLRKGLVPPPRPKRDLTDEEKKGKVIFESDAAKCKQCHSPDTEFTTRLPYPIKTTLPPGFEEEENNNFKAPSLFFVGGTAPYYHDGSAPTLEALIAGNKDRMGTTSHLSAAERAALVAYLETL